MRSVYLTPIYMVRVYFIRSISVIRGFLKNNKRGRDVAVSLVNGFWWLVGYSVLFGFNFCQFLSFSKIKKAACLHAAHLPCGDGAKKNNSVN